MATFEDETLAELVRNYKVRYDKVHPEFHRKDIKNNAWKEVAEALGTDDKIIKSYFYLHYNPSCFCFHLGNWQKEFPLLFRRNSGKRILQIAR